MGGGGGLRTEEGEEEGGTCITVNGMQYAQSEYFII